MVYAGNYHLLKQEDLEKKGLLMMKAIVDGKLYDTKTAEKIIIFERKCTGPELAFMPGYCVWRAHEIVLYRTKKAAWFEHDENAGTITPVTEEDAKDLIRRLDADKFIELFGEVPEA